MIYLIQLFGLVLLFASCSTNNKENDTGPAKVAILDTPIVYTQPSKLSNSYVGFNSTKAINKIAEIENEYFNNYRKDGSRYYGSVWKESAELYYEEGDSCSTFENYESQLLKRYETSDSMDCTVYSMSGLQAGLDTNYKRFLKLHEAHWKKNDYAGWSVAYILTKHFNWKAVLLISTSSIEYDLCVKNYRRDKKYHVWRQPNIPLERVFDFDAEKTAIDSLLALNEFGWAFSYQGWHTWITRFKELKQCNWSGSPWSKMEENELFWSSRVTEYYSYDSHVIVFPPKQKKPYRINFDRVFEVPSGFEPL